LKDALNRKKFITYATVNSFRISSNFNIKFLFLADGWPVSLYSSLIKLKKVQRLSFYKLRRFWLDTSRANRCAIVGYSEEEIKSVIDLGLQEGINFIFHSDGYKSTTQLVHFIEEIHDSVDLVFLGTGQPKQEEIMQQLCHLEGKISIVSCGAFWIQELGIKKEVNGLLTFLGIVSIGRFYNQPLELFKRTLLSLPFMFLNFKK
jgi:UDP-N-acetyl-D-mannosaminuronic acid transferase (WecB/TagA/CpsF family)